MSPRSTQLTTAGATGAQTGRTHRLGRLGRLALLVAVCVGGVAVGVPTHGVAVAQAQVTSAAPQKLSGGLSGVTLGGLAVARDGTGGLIYTATTGGVSHVYFSRLLGGVFQTPQQLDTGALTSATQPVLTADNGGQVLVAFVSGGAVYASDALSSTSPLSSPQLIATNASNPSISMNLYGVGYLAYTAAAGAGDNVDVDYFDGTSWTPASPEAMNDTPGDVAGTGTDGPSIVAASDGVGVVAWGEGGHVYSRRVWGTATSVEVEQDDVASYGGLSEVSATSPQVASGGDSTYPDIVFTESFQSGPSTVTRAMLTRLVAEDTRSAVAIDGIGTTGQNGIQPDVAMGELGRGLITAVTGTAANAAAAATTHATSVAPFGVESTVLGENGSPGTPQATAGPDESNPEATPGVFGSTASGLVWDQDNGAGISQVLLSYAPDGITLAPPIALSSALAGQIQPASGLLLAGDSRADAAAAWVQGSVGGLAIYTDQLYTPEGEPGLHPANVYTNAAQPVLAWNASAEDWGTVNYVVSLNGTPVAQTTATSLTLGAGLTDGTYSWGVTATNAVGNQIPSEPGKIVLDTFAPRLRLRLTGTPLVNRTQHLTLSYTDPPNPTEPGATASGVKSVSINWGDGSKTQTSKAPTRVTHTYAKAGLYQLVVTVSDEANNLTPLTRLVRVLP